MYLSEIFEHLTDSELSQVNIGGSKLGGIQEEDFPKIIRHINLGMIDLYKKFDLSEKEVIIQMFDHISEYHLKYIYAVTEPTVPGEEYRYIIDVPESPFQEDVMQIQSFWDELGEEIPMNDNNKEISFFTPNPTTIQVLEPNGANSFSVIYKAYPIKLATHNIDPALADLNLPDQFMTAMLAYIGHRAYMTQDKPDISMSSKYLGKYAGICKEIKELGTINKSRNDTNMRLERNGWV